MPILLLAPIAAFAGAVVLVIAIVSGVSRPPTASAAARAALRHGQLITALAWIMLTLGLAVGLVLGRTVGLSPTGAVSAVLVVAGLLYVAVHAVGELNFPRPQGAIRRASLVPRSVADVAPRWLRTATWAWLGLAVAIAVAGALTSSDGRSITRSTGTASPYPGPDYALPALVAIAVLVLAAEGALRLVARRPAVMDADPEWDLALRRLGAHRALRGGQLTAGLTVAALLFYGGIALHSVGLGGLSGGVIALAALVAGTAAVLAFVPAAAPTTEPGFAPGATGAGVASLSGATPKRHGPDFSG